MIRRFFKKKSTQKSVNEITRAKTKKRNQDLEDQIEQLRRERDELATLVAGIQDAILAVDSQGSALFYNSQLELLFPTLQLEYHEGDDILSQIAVLDIAQAFRFSLKGGRNYSLKSVPVLVGDIKKYVSLSISSLKRPDRSVYGAVGIFHDVTELTLAEKMRIDFVGNVSHELRTPLTSIKGYTDTLALDIAEGREPDLKFLKIISRNVSRLMDLISDLLDLSSLDAGVDVIHKDRIDTESLTDRVLDQMRQRFDKRTRPIEIKIKAPFVWADQKRIEQILTNLLDNALKYTPDDAAISVSWEPHQGSHDVLLKVKDQGPGIPKEAHDRLFERFYRVDKGRSRDQGGTGLGLAIVKHIMQRHGGAVWIQSEIGVGTQFTCQFPDAAPIRG